VQYEIQDDHEEAQGTVCIICIVDNTAADIHDGSNNDDKRTKLSVGGEQWKVRVRERKEEE
jgi:uncharacterized protein CbrC (UPF0167 family)